MPSESEVEHLARLMQDADRLFVASRRWRGRLGPLWRELENIQRDSYRCMARVAIEHLRVDAEKVKEVKS